MAKKDDTSDSTFVPVEKTLLHITPEKRKYALERCESYKESIADYLAVKDSIPTGRKLAAQYVKNKKRILDVLGGTDDDWKDWRWHLRNTIRSVDQLVRIIDLSKEEHGHIRDVEEMYRWGVSPYYASLMDRKDRNCPVRMQSIPIVNEVLDTTVEKDPETVLYNSPAPLITRLYPDRLIINVTNACAMFCRHCLRRRHISHENLLYSKKDISMALDYVQEHEEIRDVLITGGDAFALT
ncbi:MAG: hypothetical protein QF415_16995, partial [Candidatus Undinarchaeales archaeon]|nr:hypothetical protein [Candidatus Undinarchaeales archaeon]